eukprot:10775-Heterococcus_DN1.PRE.4
MSPKLNQKFLSLHSYTQNGMITSMTVMSQCMKLIICAPIIPQTMLQSQTLVINATDISGATGDDIALL